MFHIMMKKINKAAVFLLATPSLLTAGVQAKPEKRPNVLFIQCDQLNLMALSCYGGSINTPNIDRLAREGVRFTDAVCSTPISSPARGSMVTGLYPHQNGVVGNIDNELGLPHDYPVTDMFLNRAGYSTHLYGKWHLEYDGTTREMGLDYYPDPYTYERQYRDEFRPVFNEWMDSDKGEWMDYYGLHFPVELSKEWLEIRPHLVEAIGDNPSRDLATKMGRFRGKESQWLDAISTAKTLERLDSCKASGKPFSITCSYIWPHDPNFIHNPYYEDFKPEDFTPSQVDTIEDLFKKDFGYRLAEAIGDKGKREFLRIYYGAVKCIDDQIGLLYDRLIRNGQLDNTIIIFTADHGDMLTCHSMIWKSTTAFYREIVNVPLIIRYPAAFGASVCDAQVCHLDIPATIFALTNQKMPWKGEGFSLVPLMQGKMKAADFRKYNFCERVRADHTTPGVVRGVGPASTGAFMVQSAQWKYMIYPSGHEYLYDRILDPAETKNLVADPAEAKIKEELHDVIRNWLLATGWKGVNPSTPQSADTNS